MTNKTELLPCPFCAAQGIPQMSNRVIYALVDHDDFCPMSGSMPTLEKWNTRAAPAEDFRAVVDEPEPFIVGNQYRTQDGDLVRFVEIHNAGKSHETIRDEFGHHRYTQKSHLIGRVTGSAHDFSHPGNVPPLYRHPLPGADFCKVCIDRHVAELNK